MEIRHLRYFSVLAEQLHFTKAAELLNIAQSALSSQIKRLEYKLGVKLVARTNRRVQLTAAGEVFREHATRILQQVESAARQTIRTSNGEAGTVIVGVVSSAVCSLLPTALRGLRKEAPDVIVDVREMEPAEQVDALHRESIDIGLLFLNIQDRDLDSKVLSSDRLILALPAGHPAASQKKVKLRTLSKETFLLPRQQPLPGFYESALDAIRSSGISEPRIQPTRLLQTAVFLVAGQLGISLVPDSFRRNLRVKGVVYREIAGASTRVELIALWRKDNFNPSLNRFIHQLSVQPGPKK